MSSPGTDRSAALREALHRWCEALEGLRITLTEDRPAPGFSALADRLGDATDEVSGWLQEAEAGLALPDADQTIPRLVSRALRTQGDVLFGCLHQAQLDRLARTGGPSWHGWVTAVRAAAEPLWGRAEETIKQLTAPSLHPLEPLSHTTYHTTHIRHSETINPST